jgi:hypothetical protein
VRLFIQERSELNKQSRTNPDSAAYREKQDFNGRNCRRVARNQGIKVARQQDRNSCNCHYREEAIFDWFLALIWKCVTVLESRSY